MLLAVAKAPTTADVSRGSIIRLLEVMRCLTRLGRDVQIVVKETTAKRAEGRVTVHFG